MRERGPFDFLRRMWHRTYQSHPDTSVEALVYSLLADLVDCGGVTKAELVAEMAANHIRHDSLALVDLYHGWSLTGASPSKLRSAAAAI